LRLPDIWDRIPDAKFRIPVTGCRMLDTGRRGERERGRHVEGEMGVLRNGPD